MTAKFPAAIATSADLGQPNGTDMLDSPDHAGIHRQITDELIAIETALGTGLSNVLNKVKAYRGDKDLTAAIAGYVPVAGDLVRSSTAGNLDASWSGLSGATVVGDMYLFGGTDWAALTGSELLPASAADARYAGGAAPPPELVFAATKNAFPATGGADKFYIAQNSNKVYVWDASLATPDYVLIHAAGLSEDDVLTDAGDKDVSVAIGAYTPAANQVITVNKDAAAVDASWVGIASPVYVGEQFMWNGTAWVAPDNSKLTVYGVEERRYVSNLALGASTLGDGTNPSVARITIAGVEYRGDRQGDKGAGDPGNMAFGKNALQMVDRPQGGCNNVAVGEHAGEKVKAGSDNVLLGGRAGSAITDGAFNVLIGPFAGAYGDPSMVGSVGIGWNALQNAQAIVQSVCVGAKAGQSARGLEKVVVVGNFQNGGTSKTVPLNKGVLIGSDAALSHNNTVVIGCEASSTKDNQVVLGGPATAEVTTTGVYVGTIGGNQQRMIGLDELKTIVAAAADFNAFKTAIAALN